MKTLDCGLTWKSAARGIMTNQEIFDKVVRHLVAQGKPAFEDESCKYLTASGEKCAAGCLLPEVLPEGFEDPEGFSTTTNNYSWDEVCLSYPEFREIGSGPFILKIQSAHDRGANSSFWRELWYQRMLVLAEDACVDNAVLLELATPEWRSLTL